MPSIEDKLNQLAELKSQADTITMHYQQIKESAIPPEVITAVAEIEAECDTDLEPVKQKIASLEDEIRNDTAKLGRTVKGTFIRSVFVPGRTTWETYALNEYALDHPEVERFRKIGKPSVRIENI